ncbi:MAG TPA: L-glutamate gamma-semialdehyde dehydrogenase, partial [Bacteroidales bacterium]|nr:L-glutamate gamma-semialdehyde dehydrogenase [Bacteroidales bacterium]
MNNAIFSYDMPGNEPVKPYLPGSPERDAVKAELKRLSAEVIDIPLIIGGKEVRTGDTAEVVMPHNHHHVLAHYHKASAREVAMAVEAADKARKEWGEMPWVERMSITVKAAELLATKYRALINASTMLGQSKNIFQAEIDAACETVDFLRFNAHFMGMVYADQPISDPGILNRVEYRPLEGFVFTVTPFNFTSIAANLNMSPALMGNTTIWKPATTALFSNYFMMKIFQEAGLPDGVINFLPGKGSVIGNGVFAAPSFAGIHFTGSNVTFNQLWRMASENLPRYHAYPKIVGETGGKDFIFVHASAGPAEVATAIVRGAFEFQGQKCSAASRAYIPASLWPEVRDIMGGMLDEVKMGDPVNFTHFFNAVIDEASFDNIMGYIAKAKESADVDIVFGGKGDKSEGYFVEPTVLLTRDPHFISMEEEIFGPVITIYVYQDDKYEETLRICDSTSPYGLTGAIFASDRKAVLTAMSTLRYAAGNFYINDKPTGAVVG